jgi:U32 family peptidase
VNHQKLVNGKFSSHRGALIGIVEKIEDNKLKVLLHKNIHLQPGDGVLWAYSKGSEKIETGAQIYQIQRLNNSTALISFAHNIKLKPEYSKALLYLNHDVDLKKQNKASVTDKSQLKRVLIDYIVEVKLHTPIKVTCTDGMHSITICSQSPLASAQTQSLSDEQIHQELSALGGSIFKLRSVKIERTSNDAVFMNQRELKQLRQQLISELASLRQANTIDGFHNTLITIDEVQNWFSLTTQINTNFDTTPIKQAETKKQLVVLLRERAQVEDFVKAYEDEKINKSALNSVILDFEFGRDYISSIQALKDHGIRSGVATTRILKPQEYNNLKALERLNPDIILVRNLGALRFYKELSKYQGELRGDFSLNVTNHLSAQYLISKGLSSICASYDLNAKQLEDIIKSFNPAQLEVTVHQYMPSFHMEHCVFAAFLSQGSSFKDCGKPCEKHQVELKDQYGNRHFIKPDQECRNTMYNAVSQSAATQIPRWLDLGLNLVRYEALNERSEELIQKIVGYQRLLTNEITPKELVQSLNLVEKYGLGEGNLLKSKVHVNRKRKVHTKLLK